MNKKLGFVWLLWAIGLISFAQTPVKKAIYIIMDGIPTDIIHKASTPNLDRIVKEGVFLNSHVGGIRGDYRETPTISANGYAILVTGTWANKNNVWDNSLKAPNYNYPTLFKLYKDAYPDGKIGIFSTWLDNRTKLLGEDLPETGGIKFNYHFDGLEIDTQNYPHDNKSLYIKRIDAEVAMAAAKSVYKDGPNLSWVYLQYTDDVGHHYGDSPELYNSITFQDALVGLIYDSVKQREEELGEEWLFVVVTDHGRTPVTARHHGGQSDNERNTWMVMNKKDINQYALNYRTAGVDLLPTICGFLGVEIPADTQYELDGVSVLKEVDAFDLKASLNGNKSLEMNWNAINKEKDVQAEVLVSFTNNIKEGGKDTFQKIADVNVKEGKASIPVKLPKNSEFLKVVLKTPNNTLNYWVQK
ncbi:alkaline phosphatase family protein [Proteiniphilum sp.]|uniref:alkaline phosphatase family protein n=1 Tax=Proteiniphilum sp. TaxID=1926877 RepID=UPI002B20BC38|nr:alkaline phosphatase family protein [Proteiniphilum sp.]MEA4917825.1 alkaline phosphatase family protein [Proteiniphilum sp.]